MPHGSSRAASPPPTAARRGQGAFPPPDGGTAPLVVRRADHAPLTVADVRQARTLARRAAGTAGVRSLTVSPAGLSSNHRVLLGSVLFDKSIFHPTITKDVKALRQRRDALFARSGLVAGY